MEITEEQKNDQTIAQKDRPSEEEDETTNDTEDGDSTETAKDTTNDETTDGNQTEEDDYEQLDDTPLINSQKVNWDGVVVVEGEIPWKDKKIGNTNFT